MTTKNILEMVTSCIDVVINNRTYGLLTKTTMINTFTDIGSKHIAGLLSDEVASDLLLDTFAEYSPKTERRFNNRIRAEMHYDATARYPYVVYLHRSNDGERWTRGEPVGFKTLESAENYLVYICTSEHRNMLAMEAKHAKHAS